MMKDLKRILMSALMLCVLSAGALAGDDQKDQKRDPPPKDPKVIQVTPKEQPKRESPPPRNEPKRDDKKPPLF
jgi:hypothetical protein